MSDHRLDIQNVLGQMRSIREQMNPPANNANRPEGPGFASQLQQAREQANPAGQVQDSLAPQGINATQSTPPGEDVPSFGDMFKSAINTVNDNQQAASGIATRYEMGDPSVDLPEVMIALQKSSVSFQAMTEVRNKMVEAYKEIMNMPI